MLTEMDLGLKGEKGGLMMLPSYVDILPTGYAIYYIPFFVYYTISHTIKLLY